MDNITPHYVNLGILKFSWHFLNCISCLCFFDIFDDLGPFNLIIPVFVEQHSYTTRNVSSEQLYIFSLTEQTLESSLPLLLNDIFGTIFPFPFALGLLKNYSRIPSSVIVYPNTK